MMNDSHPIIGHETITGIQTEKIPNRKTFFSATEYYTEEFYLFPESQVNAIVDLREVGEKVDLEGEEAIVLTRGLDEPIKYKSPQPEMTVLEDKLNINVFHPCMENLKLPQDFLTNDIYHNNETLIILFLNPNSQLIIGIEILNNNLKNLFIQVQMVTQ